ncbi:hypothetical protein ACFQ07_27955 [Actinomadura adrarensis]|uniref:Uncharacterized protein n=1 Tax=Actinomadura adrarensis TaxID=1819600 RepID=A0ABW3CPC5_9ACTN
MEGIVSLGNYVRQSDFAREHEAKGYAGAYVEGYAEAYAKGYAEGMCKGMARMLLVILASKKVSVSAEARERILACRDEEQFERWADLTVTISAADELFA